jgi:hypothetical protein
MGDESERLTTVRVALRGSARESLQGWGIPQYADQGMSSYPERRHNLFVIKCLGDPSTRSSEIFKHLRTV